MIDLKANPFFLDDESIRWVEETKAAMSTEEKLQQLFFPIAYSPNEEFELYYQNELYYFYPKKGERNVCTRVALLFEMLKGE